MKNNLPLLIAVIFSILLAACSTSSRVRIGDQQDLNAYILKQAVQTGNKGGVVKIPKGTYHFYEDRAIVRDLYISNHDQDNPKKIGINLTGLENVVIDGSGSEFIFHGKMLPIVLQNSRSVTLKNFSIDFALPQIRQLEVLEVDTAADESLVKLYPSGNYVIKEGKLIFTDGERQLISQWAMPFKADGRLAYGRADVDFKPQLVTEVSPDVFRVNGWSQNKLTTPGERFALRTFQRPTPGIFLDQNTNTVLENVAVHYAEGMGLLAQLCENVHLDGFAVSLKKDDPRYFTTQADATHFSGCKGKIISENGLYEGMADDAINVHGTYLRITKRVSGTTIEARYMHPQAWGFLWGEVGDTVQLIESEKMGLVGERVYTIRKIKAVDKPSEFGAKVFEITLDSDIPQEVSEKGKYGIENLTWTPEVIFRKNIIRNNRARGSLFSTPKPVICEDNLFDHTHGTAILLAGDCNGWFETGACRNVIIRNNRFVNSLTAYYQFTNAIISIYPEIPQLEKQQKFFHSNIVIENNLFETFDRPVLYAKSVDGLVFENNEVKHNNEYQPFHWNKHMFLFEKVKNVKITENKLGRDFNEEKDVETKLSGKDAVLINNNG